MRAFRAGLGSELFLIFGGRAPKNASDINRTTAKSSAQVLLTLIIQGLSESNFLLMCILIQGAVKKCKFAVGRVLISFDVCVQDRISLVPWLLFGFKRQNPSVY